MNHRQDGAEAPGPAQFSKQPLVGNGQRTAGHHNHVGVRCVARSHGLDGEVQQLGGGQKPGNLHAIEAVELQNLDPAGAQPGHRFSPVDLGTLQLGEDHLEQSGGGPLPRRGGEQLTVPGGGREHVLDRLAPVARDKRTPELARHQR